MGERLCCTCNTHVHVNKVVGLGTAAMTKITAGDRHLRGACEGVMCAERVQEEKLSDGMGWG